jgi:hypothetical protein
MDFNRLVWRQVPIGKGWENAFSWPVEWISVPALDAAWRADDEYVGASGVGSNQPGKYDRVGQWLLTGDYGFIWIPALSLDGPVPVFTDGRHRFAWLRDHGLRALPVEVNPDLAPTVRARFGTSERVGHLIP